MRNLSRSFAVTLMAAAFPATIVFAQEAPAGDKAVPSRRTGLHPMTLARLEDGRIAFAKAALKLSPDQDKLWAPVEEKIRANFYGAPEDVCEAGMQSAQSAGPRARTKRRRKEAREAGAAGAPRKAQRAHDENVRVDG